MRSSNARALWRGKKRFPWERYMLDTLLAFVGAMGVTSIIYFYHLYPRIPNISIIYLLVVLPLAINRGRYSAMLTSVIAFLAFDFFVVPPLYTLTINRIEEWIALVIFLIDALLTGQLAAALRQRAEVATRREREARALYHLVHVSNNVEDAQAQLRAICQAVVETFASWGVQTCTLLQADAGVALRERASASNELVAKDEQTRAEHAETREREIDLHGSGDEKAARGEEQRAQKTDKVLRRPIFFQASRALKSAAEKRGDRSVHLVPLTLGHKKVGVLRLEVVGDPGALLFEEYLGENRPSDALDSFFWTFINQVTAQIERANLQQENLHLAILKRTDALRSALLSSVSHDLRTPLTAIKAAASSLLQEDVEWHEEARRGFLQSIENEADRLNRLVANLLDMSRIEDGALIPDKDWYSLKALIQDVLGRLAPMLEEHPMHLDLPEDLLMVELDYLQIDQVLTNLLENIVRHTPARTPIDLRAYQEGEQVIVRVIDHGPGIARAHLEHVFDKFYRVMHGPVSTSTPPGSGLGLAVCRGLVEAHGGRIWAELRPEGGLIVCVALPCKESERIVL
jgi:two-component system sensor histidine kinase KdpD